MSATECKQCGGDGMPQHKAICGGVCFACGVLPAGEKASSAFVATAREKIIGRMINSWKQGNLDAHGEDKAHTIAVINAAPADVALRARKAFGFPY